ncbi:hypothetical protein BSKO_10881 [Bryopsis sp. KO-2023]|nr:hypothetical protein BSKO_10881 [Bryopsis sp. KO-2023]
MDSLKVGVSSLATGDIQGLLMSAGSSGMLGVAIGAVLKRAVRWLAVVIGSVAILMQVLIYLEFIEVHWKNVEKKAVPYLDVNQDGVVNDGDVQHIVDAGVEILTQGLPNVAGFMAGLLVAFRFL